MDANAPHVVFTGMEAERDADLDRSVNAFTGIRRRDHAIDSYTGATLPKADRRWDPNFHPSAHEVRAYPRDYLAMRAIREAEKAARRDRMNWRRTLAKRQAASTYRTRAERITAALERCTPEQRDRLIAAAIAAY